MQEAPFLIQPLRASGINFSQYAMLVLVQKHPSKTSLRYDELACLNYGAADYFLKSLLHKKLITYPTPQATGKSSRPPRLYQITALGINLISNIEVAVQRIIQTTSTPPCPQN